MAESAVVPTLEKKPPQSAAATDSLTLILTVTDVGSIEELEQCKPDQREVYALAALRIGLISLRHARGQVDAQAIRSESERLIGELSRTLDGYSKKVQDSMTDTLRDYFDPQSGRLPERIERLIKRDGELEQAIRRQVGREDSELAKTLSTHIGENSPLLKLLSPRESEGVVKALEVVVIEALGTERDRILAEFSLDNPGSALQRLVRDIDAKSSKLQGDLAQQIQGVIGEFSLDKSDSALSRLVKRVEDAQKTITNEFSLDNDRSALCRMSKVLEKTTQAIDNNLTLDDEKSALYRLRRELTDILTKHEKSATDFQQQVHETLAKLTAKREEQLRSTRHGEVFEDKVCSAVEFFSQKTGDVVSRTGTTTGAIKYCKVGDCIVELGDDCVASGAKIVVEAKEDASYDLAKAKGEIDVARKNRDAGIGIFVFSKRTSPNNLESLVRHGNDVFVIWDSEDAASDVLLNAAIMLAKGLSVKRRKAQEGVLDLVPLEAGIDAVEKEAQRLGSIKTWSETIKSNSEKILNEVVGMTKNLTTEIQSLRETCERVKATVGGEQQ